MTAHTVSDLPLAVVPDAARSTIEEVPVSELHFGFSPRHSAYDADHVAVLAGILPQLPPILVHAPTMRVIDGVHRVMAVRSAGETTIRVVFFHGSEDEASIHAVKCNVTHGKPLTVAEREAAARRVLKVHIEWSDRRIAAVCGLSPKTIARLRQVASDRTQQTDARVGRDGRARPVDPVEVRHRIAKALRLDPGASTREIASRTCASQATVRDVRTRLCEGQDVLPPALRKAFNTSEQAAHPPSVQDDQAYSATPAGREFADWFDARILSGDAEWESFVTAVPISRAYELADAARRCAGSWGRFASAMEARATSRRA